MRKEALDRLKDRLDKMSSALIDLKIGDIILTGRFRNHAVEVKTFGTDENGQPTVNGRPMLNFRIKKLMPEPEKK